MAVNNLFEVTSVKFDASGSGLVRMGPSRYGVTWNVSRIITTCTTPNTQQVTFIVYLGFVSPTTQIGGTYSGQQDSDDISMPLHSGDILIGQWTGGSLNDVGTMSIMGTLEDARR